MTSLLDFKNISVGDLLIEELRSPPDIVVVKRGIIVEISNNISTVEWTIGVHDKKYLKLRIQNSSLRKMIMTGQMKHYPIN